MEGIVTGCDRNLEWLLPWWWGHYANTNSFPVAFADFGMSQEAKDWCQERGRLIPIEGGLDASSYRDSWKELYGNSIQGSRSAWLKKPLALFASPFPYTLWIDLDCEVRAPLDPLFAILYLGCEIAAAQDFDGKQVLKPEEIAYNSGVVAVRKESQIVGRWIETSRRYERELPGDEEMLSRAIHEHRPRLIELPILYNWFYEYGFRDDVKIVHYAGSHGKIKILEECLHWPTETRASEKEPRRNG